MLLLVRCLVLGLRLLTVQRLDLALENVALRHQLEVLARSRKRAPLTPADRLLWSWIARLWPRWRRHLVSVRPVAACTRAHQLSQGVLLKRMRTGHYCRSSSPLLS
jgi:hypothetical protein